MLDEVQYDKDASEHRHECEAQPVKHGSHRGCGRTMALPSLVPNGRTARTLLRLQVLLLLLTPRLPRRKLNLVTEKVHRVGCAAQPVALARHGLSCQRDGEPNVHRPASTRRAPNALHNGKRAGQAEVLL